MKPTHAQKQFNATQWKLFAALYLHYIVPLNLVLRFGISYYSHSPLSCTLFQIVDWVSQYYMGYIDPFFHVSGRQLTIHCIVHGTLTLQTYCYFLRDHALSTLAPHLYLFSYFGIVALRDASFIGTFPVLILNAILGPMYWGDRTLFDMILLQTPFFISLSGLSMLKHIVERLKSENTQKERENIMIQSKSELFRLAAHELRNPLQAMIFTIQYLFDMKLEDYKSQEFDEVSGIVAESVQDLKTTANLMKSLVENVLDFNLIESNKLKFNKINFSMVELVENIIEIFYQTAKKKGLEMYSFLDLTLPKSMNGDKMRLTQIMCNFCYNAIKFTNSGSIEVRAEIYSKNPFVVQLSCIDTGIGINDQDVERIFKPFTQGHKDDSTKGWGLGLSISSEIVKALGGEIGLTRLKKGSNFWIRVPMEQYSSESLSDYYKEEVTIPSEQQIAICFSDKKLGSIVENYLEKFGVNLPFVAGNSKDIPLDSLVLSDEEIDKKDGFKLKVMQKPFKMRQLCNIFKSSKIRSRKSSDKDENSDSIFESKSLEVTPRTPRVEISVLVVEDEEIIHKLIVKILNKSSFHTFSAYNGIEGLRILESNLKTLPNCALIDFQMPHMNGLQFIERIRCHHDENVRNLPLCMVSATGANEFTDFLKKYNVESIQKPVMPRDLLNIVAKLMNQKSGQ